MLTFLEMLCHLLFASTPSAPPARTTQGQPIYLNVAKIQTTFIGSVGSKSRYQAHNKRNVERTLNFDQPYNDSTVVVSRTYPDASNPF